MFRDDGNAKWDEDEMELKQMLDDTIVRKMVEGSARPFAVAVSNIADKENDGSRVDFVDTRTPYELIFRAPDSVKERFSDDLTDKPWYEVIQDNLKAGEVIYEVYAYMPGYDGLETIDDKIADIVLDSDLYTSQWADNFLYFKHEQVHLDRKYWPMGLKRDLRRNGFDDLRFDRNSFRWGNTVPDFWPSDPMQAKEVYIDQFDRYGCPFAWLLGLH